MMALKGIISKGLKYVGVNPSFEKNWLNKSWTRYIPKEYLDKVNSIDFALSEKWIFTEVSLIIKNTAIAWIATFGVLFLYKSILAMLSL